MVNAADMATKLNVTTSGNLAKKGLTHIGRYLADETSWKGLTLDEVNAVKTAGMKIFSLFEKGGTKINYFTTAQGKQDALDAYNWAKKVGQPEGTAIYFAVDFDCQAKDFPTILAYFKAIKANLKGYKMGAYGSYAVLTYLYSQKIVDYYFQTYAWSGGKHCSFTHIFQYQNGQTIAGVTVDYVNIEKPDIGAWGQDVAKPEQTKEVIDMLPQAIVISGYADFPAAELLSEKLQCPIYVRGAIANGTKVANEILVVGGNKDGLVADKFTVLAGADRYETAAAVKKFLG